MHSSLHAEARLTQRLVEKSCRHCSRRCDSPRRFFHRSRSQHFPRARHDASSAPTGPPSEKKQDFDNRPEIASTAPPSSYALPASVAQHFFNQGGPPADDSEQPATNIFYGSPTNRKMRSRGLKELPEPAAVAPEWFKENNVTLWGEGQPSSMQEVEGSRATIVRDTDLNQESASAGDVPSPSNSPTPPKELDLSQTDGAKSDPIGFGGPTTKRFSSLRPGHSRYYIDASQDAEIMHTVKGLINAPEKKEYQDEPAVKTTHLILHYAFRDGELLLDEYVRNLALRLESDLVTLDAQDIADLICKAQKGPEITKAGRMLSYEALQPEPKLEAPSEQVFGHDGIDQASTEDFDDDDDHDHIGSPSARNPLGMPVVIGKPITIDLGNMFGSPRGRQNPAKSSNLMMPSNFFSDVFQLPHQKQRDSSNPFAATVESLLSVLQSKRIRKAKEGSENIGASTDKMKRVSGRDQAIVQIKGVKAIQDVKVGHQFVAELFRQVEKRRANGENIMLIGTESEKLDASDIPSWKIQSLQKAKSEEISRTIVITPVHQKKLFNTVFRSELYRDNERRITAINMRHIWEMMRLKTTDDFLDLQPGFWNDDIYSKLSKEDQSVLRHEVWSFSHVHRICSYMSGLSKPLPSVPSALFPEPWPEDKIMPLISRVSELLGNSDRSKVKWADEQQEDDMRKGLSKPVEDTRLAEIKASATKHEKRLMSGIIEPDKISTTFEDVHAPRETVDALQTLTMLSLIRPEAFSYGVLASDKIPGLLLYGPPGTGKTLLAKAVAKESGATMLEVSAAEINDMFVGEGEKNVKALFSLAKKLSPCVVFLDEADAMFSARSNSGRRVSHRELLNQFLKEWDGMSNDSGSAFIMVATNRPMDLDDAVLRRLPRRLLIDLPAEADRHEILKIHLRNEQLAEDIDLLDLAKKTPFYSGSDLKNLAVTAALNAVREENEAFKKHKETGEEPYQFPEKRTLTKEHFEKALEEISASISEDMSSLRDIKKFDEQYGDKRGKRKKGPKWGFKSAKEADKVLDTVKVRN